MSSKNGTKIGTDNLVGNLSSDVAETRDNLGDTAEAAAEKVDGKVHVRHAAWWAAIGGGVVAAAAATAAAALRWRQARRTPRARAIRAWRGLTDRIGG